MKKANVALITVGLIIILFAVFSPLKMAEVHNVSWRIIISLLGCFLFVAGIYKTVRKC